jgi:hypothetical protein
MFEDMTPELIKSLAGKQVVARAGDSETRRTRNRRGPKGASIPNGNGQQKRRVPVAEVAADGMNGDAVFKPESNGPGSNAGPGRGGENRRPRGGRSRKPKPKVVVAV